MKRILYVSCNFTYGGVEQYILNTVDHINRDLFSVDVLLPEGRFYDREPDLLKRNVRVIKYPCQSIFSKMSAFYKIIRQEKYDIVHFHTGHESALLSLIGHLAGQRKMIVHAHTPQSGDENNGGLHTIFKKVVFFLSAYIYRWFTGCVACSYEAAAFMFGRFADRAIIVENGIDLHRFWNNRPRTGNSLCINARFDMPKNPYFVVDIMAELAKINPDVHLEWIGTGTLQESIQKKITQSGLSDRISLLGFCNDVENVLARNDFFLLPSLYEGLGIVLIEAQAAGMQCFISDASPEKANCGYCTVIPLSYSAKQWAEIINREMSHADGRKRDVEKLMSFDIRETTKRLETIYAELLNGD